MIDVKKVKLMASISVYENNIGKKDIKMNRSKPGTYIRMKVIESILCITIAYILVAGLYSVRYLSSVITGGFRVFKPVAIYLVIIYLVLMVLSLIMTFFYYRRKYRKAHRRIVLYDRKLAMLEAYLREGSEPAEEPEEDEEKEDI